MILTCPSCSAQYKLESALLPDEGQKVKCAKCAHVWFQTREDLTSEPEQTAREETVKQDAVSDEAFVDADKAEDLLEDPSEEKYEQEQEQEIPHGVKPDRDENRTSLPLKPVPTMAQRLGGLGAAFAVIFLVIILLFGMKKQIVTSWPASARFYELAGSPVTLKGEGLVIETLQAVRANNAGNNLLVTGRISNFLNRTIDVPPMQATIRTENGAIQESWVIPTPVDIIQAGESFSFTSRYQGNIAASNSVSVTFLPAFAE